MLVAAPRFFPVVFSPSLDCLFSPFFLVFFRSDKKEAWRVQLTAWTILRFKLSSLTSSSPDTLKHALKRLFCGSTLFIETITGVLRWFQRASFFLFFLHIYSRCNYARGDSRSRQRDQISLRRASLIAGESAMNASTLRPQDRTAVYALWIIISYRVIMARKSEWFPEKSSRYLFFFQILSNVKSLRLIGQKNPFVNFNF